MAEKTIKSRVLLKNDIKANWDQAENFSPLPGEIIIYNDGMADGVNAEKMIKIGDGVTNVKNLPFLYEPFSDSDIDRICQFDLTAEEVMA